MAPGLRGWGDGRTPPSRRPARSCSGGRPVRCEPGAGDRAAFGIGRPAAPSSAGCASGSPSPCQQRRPPDAAAPDERPARALRAMLDPTTSSARSCATPRAVAAVVHEVDGDEVPAELIADVVARHHVRRAVVTRPSPLAEAVGARLVDRRRRRQRRPRRSSRRRRRPRRHGVRGRHRHHRHGRAVLHRRRRARGEPAAAGAPLHRPGQPHRAVVGRGPAGSAGRRPTLPANLVLITGPSRSGDIEQIIDPRRARADRRRDRRPPRRLIAGRPARASGSRHVGAELGCGGTCTPTMERHRATTRSSPPRCWPALRCSPSPRAVATTRAAARPPPQPPVAPPPRPPRAAEAAAT